MLAYNPATISPPSALKYNNSPFSSIRFGSLYIDMSLYLDLVRKQNMRN